MDEYLITINQPIIFSDKFKNRILAPQFLLKQKLSNKKKTQNSKKFIDK